MELRLCEIIQAMLGEVGIEAQLNMVASEDFRQHRNDPNKHGLARQAYYPRPDPDYVLRRTLHSTGNRATLVGYGNPEVDRLLDEAVGIYDLAKAGALYIQAIEIAFEDAPYTGLFRNVKTVAMSAKVRGHTWYADTILRLRELWFER